MNIKVQACGFVLLMVLHILYHRQRTLRTYSKEAFVRLYVSTVLCIAMDILSVATIEYRSMLPEVLVEVICKGYLVTLVLTALCAVLYIGVDIILYDKNFFKWGKVLCAVIGAVCLVILCLPVSIYCDSESHVVYTHGLAPLTTYFGAVGLILLNFYLIIKYKKYIRVRRYTAMVLWMVLWIGSAAIQFLNAELLVVGFGACLGVMVTYLQFENPEINLDRGSGMFNQTAFTEFIQQIYYAGDSYAAFVFIDDHRFAGNDSGRLIRELGQKLLELKEARVFKTADDEIVMLIGKDEMGIWNLDSLEKYANRNLSFDDISSDNLKILILEDCILTDKPEDFFALLRYCRRKKISRTMRHLISVDASVAEEMYAEDALIKKVDEAVQADRVQVYFQPIYAVDGKTFTSAEALVRMYDEAGQQLPVFESIRASEESGLIYRIGEIVFDKVCQMIREERIERHGIRYIEVNLSVAQCADEKLAENYIHIMERYGIDPAYINLEITESATVEAKQTLLANMEKLMAYGVSFSLDDFGTGQSNLNYIMEMPVQIVKFDREMTLAYFESTRGKFVMRAAVNMIHDMGLRIVSEGIETETQLLEMEKLGIDYIQGFYFSKPLPVRQFVDFMRDADRNPGDE